MPDEAGGQRARARRDQALAEVRGWLESLASPAKPLVADELGFYERRSFTNGWRLNVDFSGVDRRFDLLVDDRFPRTALRIALVDPPPFLTWPHIERDGVLCLLPEGADVSARSPAAVGAYVLGKACELIEDCAAGRNEQDFREEFLSYWGWDTTPEAPFIYSLVDPSPPTRMIRVWRGQRFYLLSEDEAQALSWLRNRFDESKQPWTTNPAALLWLKRPLLPRDYPRTARNLLTLAREHALDGAGVLAEVASEDRSRVVALLAAPTGHGPCLAAVSAPGPQPERRRGRSGPDPLTRGFRPGKVPPAIVAERYFGGGSVERSSVVRVDAWIHGRGIDSRLSQLRAAKVAVLGCGSIGGPIALKLAQAGVGSLALVDPDKVVSANVSRHPLGLPYVGDFKARALADRIKRDYPHIVSVESHTVRWEDVASGQPDLLPSSDLIVSTMGDWASEGALNEWHVASGRRCRVVYGWTEAHACAGHAVAVVAEGGCLQCGMSETGQPLLRVVDWPKERTLAQEPACGAVYQPYGPVELTYTEALIAELVLDCLLGVVRTSHHRIWAVRRAVLEATGGGWTDEWSEIARSRPEGGFVEERTWPTAAGCPECQIAAA